MRETISHAGLKFNSSLDGNNNYIYLVVENMKTLGIARNLSYVYIYMYIYIIFLIYLYSNSITTLYHSVVSKNVFVFSMFDCL